MPPVSIHLKIEGFYPYYYRAIPIHQSKANANRWDKFRVCHKKSKSYLHHKNFPCYP